MQKAAQAMHVCQRLAVEEASRQREAKAEAEAEARQKQKQKQAGSTCTCGFDTTTLDLQIGDPTSRRTLEGIAQGHRTMGRYGTPVLACSGALGLSVPIYHRVWLKILLEEGPEKLRRLAQTKKTACGRCKTTQRASWRLPIAAGEAAGDGCMHTTRLLIQRRWEDKSTSRNLVRLQLDNDHKAGTKEWYDECVIPAAATILQPSNSRQS